MMRNGLPKKILVVDDDKTVGHSLEKYLDDAGFEVSLVGDAEEALSLVKGKNFNLAILDVRLPGMNGEELAIKLYEKCTSLRFLIYTGSSNYILPEGLRNVGVEYEHVVLKPVEKLSVFLEKINNLFNKGKSDG